MTNNRYVVARVNDQKWSYPELHGPEWPTIMSRFDPQPIASPYAQLDHLLARHDWVQASEAALALVSVSDFIGWMERYVRPLLGYGVLACGTGVFLARHVSIERLLLRGLRAPDGERLRNQTGTVVLPRARSSSPDPLGEVEMRAFAARLAPHPLPQRLVEGRGSAMERLSERRQTGSYFLFGAVARPIDLRVRYGMAMLAPHMHDALLRALQHHDSLRLPMSQGLHLTRTELNLLRFLVAGRTSSEIAKETFRSVHTVANQVRSIIRKLNARNRTEAISKALGLGLVNPVEATPQTRIIAAQPVAAYVVGRQPRVWKGRYQRSADRLRDCWARWVGARAWRADGKSLAPRHDRQYRAPYRAPTI